MYKRPFMESFNDRKEYGEIAVEHSIKILDNSKIPYITSKQYWGNKWTSSIDAKYGDIVLYPDDTNPIWIDVKRNSISKHSVKEFKGDYFWIFHHIVEIYSILLTKEELLSQPNLNESILSSGDPGYKIRNIESPTRSIRDLKRP
jgi:hypothetical protein